jgi:hypothetical protein
VRFREYRICPDRCMSSLRPAVCASTQPPLRRTSAGSVARQSPQRNSWKLSPLRPLRPRGRTMAKGLPQRIPRVPGKLAHALDGQGQKTHSIGVCVSPSVGASLFLKGVQTSKGRRR